MLKMKPTQQTRGAGSGNAVPARKPSARTAVAQSPPSATFHNSSEVPFASAATATPYQWTRSPTTSQPTARAVQAWPHSCKSVEPPTTQITQAESSPSSSIVAIPDIRPRRRSAAAIPRRAPFPRPQLETSPGLSRCFYPVAPSARNRALSSGSGSRDDVAALSSEFPLDDSLEVLLRREDGERFIEEVRGDEPELRVEERELQARRAEVEPGSRFAASPGRHSS